MILWADSFDHYGTSLTEMTDGSWASATAVDLSNTVARTGSRSLKINGNDECRRVFGGPKVTAGIAAAYYFPTLPVSDNTCQLASFADAANKGQVTFALDTTGIISAWRANTADSRFNVKLGDTGVPVVTANSWNHIEMKLTVGDAGSLEVRVNQVTVLNLSGVDTQATSLTETSQVRFTQTGAGAVGYYIDDVIAWDTSGSYNNDFVGDQKVFTDFPDADTAEVDWDPLSGTTRWQMIDENPADGDTSYDSTLDTGDRMGVTFPDLDAAVISVSAVILVNKSRKADAGTANIQVSAQSSGDETAGTDTPLTTAYTHRMDVFETDPHTAAPWAPAAAAAVAMVVERTA